MGAFLALVVKDVRQLLRDPKTMLMVLLMPILVMALFVAGYGGGGGEVPIAVVDLDGGKISWQLIDFLRNFGDFRVDYFASTPEKGEMLVKKGKVYATLIIPKGFSEDVLLGRKTGVELIIDSSYAHISELIWEALNAAVQEFQKKVSEKYNTFSITVNRRTVYGPQVTRVENFVPAVMGILLHLVPMSLIAVSISRERERRTFEQLIVTPINSSDIIMSKLLAYALITISDMIVTLWVSVEFFDVRVKGSFIDLLIISSIMLLCSLSLGLLISVVSKNQLQAYQTAIFLFIPSMLFTGFLTPVELLSNEVRLISKLLPLYYFLRTFRDIQLRGWTIYETMYEVGVLAFQTVFFLILSIKLLKLRVE